MTDINIFKFEGKPLEKLLDTIKEIWEPWTTARKAKAQGELKKILGEIERQEKLADAATNEDINDIIIQRAYQRELRYQTNINKVSMIAASEMPRNTKISEVPVDPDWVDQFFEYAKHISNEEAQILWGKILAEEVCNPDSFSKRTLGILKNISQFEAKAFQKLSSYTFEKSFILHEPLISNKYITTAEVLALQDSVLLSLVQIDFSTSELPPIWTIGAHKIDVNTVSDYCLGGYSLTQSGRELLTLMNPVKDMKYLIDLKSLLEQRYNLKIQIIS